MSTSNNSVPNWLETMLSENFFDNCNIHDTLKRNERNNFCMDCLSRFCPYCLLDHPNEHQIIHVRRHRESALIKTEDMRMRINCDSIQSFSLNRAVVLYLNKRDQGQASSRVGYYCYCGHNISRKYHYCSIACKLQAFENGEASIEVEQPPGNPAAAPPLLLPAPPVDHTDDVEEHGDHPPELIPDEPAANANLQPNATAAVDAAGNTERISARQNEAGASAAASSSRASPARARPRKGTPRRAPFF